MLCDIVGVAAWINTLQTTPAFGVPIIMNQMRPGRSVHVYYIILRFSLDVLPSGVFIGLHVISHVTNVMPHLTTYFDVLVLLLVRFLPCQAYSVHYYLNFP